MPPTGQPPIRHDRYAAWRIPAWRRLLLASVLTRIVTAGQGLAIGWELYTRTDDPMALGLVGLAQALPMILLALPAGYLADVFDRRRLIMLGMLGTTLTSVGLAGISYFQGPVWAMYFVLLLDSAFLQLAGPARQAILPLLVPADCLENAVKWNSSLGQISAMVGPVVGGMVLNWWLPGAYLVSAAGTAAFMMVLLTLKVPNAERSRRGQMFRQVGEGLAFVWRHKLLLGASSLDLFAVLLGGAVYLLPIYVKDILDVRSVGLSPEQALGWLRAAPAAGAMVMALLLTHLPPFRRAGRTLLLSVAAFGVATIVFGLSRNVWLSLVMLFLTGAFDNISVVVRHTLVLLVTPNAMRGRVSAVNSVFINCSNQLGGFESGTVAKLLGPIVSVVSGGIGTVVVVAAWAGLFPTLRRFGSLSEAAVEQGGPVASPAISSVVAASTATPVASAGAAGPAPSEA